MILQTNCVPPLIQSLIPPSYRSLKFATGKLVCVLAQNPNGLKKHELIEALHPGFSSASPLRRSALETSVTKLIQRARRKFQCQGVDISFHSPSKTWHLVTPEKPLPC